MEGTYYKLGELAVALFLVVSVRYSTRILSACANLVDLWGSVKPQQTRGSLWWYQLESRQRERTRNRRSSRRRLEFDGEGQRIVDVWNKHGYLRTNHSWFLVISQFLCQYSICCAPRLE